ncbi:unnamed protein product [Rhizoctonia solani]|uniref:ABC transporter domain-containing protein n=1 Tax=Rhizoctonia solani TaxID=456999 RepID=A0A8H2WU01_9AGAM|nr:unnamed protein product [Rhizoctonia solani]CAE6407168.1 unnamed protein product [Rhizoctonia solani]
MNQHILGDPVTTAPTPADDSQSILYIPFVSAILSATVLLIHYYLHDLDLRRSLSSGTVRKKTTIRAPNATRRPINIWKALRLGTCLILLLLAIVMLGMAESCSNPTNTKPGNRDQGIVSTFAGHGLGKHRKHPHHTDLCLTKEQSTRLSLTCFYTYTALLAFLAITLSSGFSTICNSHLTPLLLIALSIDVWMQFFPGRQTTKATLICDRLGIGFLTIASLVIPPLIWTSSPTQKHKPPPPNWPTSGRLVVQHLTARYSEDEPPTIEDVSFRAEAGERLGIVGKLGSGKDALAMALLRLIPTEGQVFYDGIGTHTVHPTVLFSHVSLISGQPFVASNRTTVRYILDPHNKYSDEALYAALNTAGLVGFGLEGGAKRVSARARYGVGFAAAVVRQSKLVVVDETTTSIEYAPDPDFHASLRCALPNATILVISNSLQNVRGVDKILVLQAGQLVEFGPPLDLLVREGPFKRLTEEMT